MRNLLVSKLLCRCLFALLLAVAFGRSQNQPTNLRITTTRLPAATSEVPYYARLSASGAIPPYRWSVVAGSLPPGLVLGVNGTIFGTTSASGFFTFIVQVIAADRQITRYRLGINVMATTRRIAVWSATFESGTTSHWYFPALRAGGNEGGGAFASGVAASTVSPDYANWTTHPNNPMARQAAE